MLSLKYIKCKNVNVFKTTTYIHTIQIYTS